MASTPTRLTLDKRKARTCRLQKVGLPSYDAALQVAEVMMEQGKVNPGCHITPYLCDECEEWHVYNRVIVPLPGHAPPTSTAGHC